MNFKIGQEVVCIKDVGACGCNNSPEFGNLAMAQGMANVHIPRMSITFENFSDNYLTSLKESKKGESK